VLHRHTHMTMTLAEAFDVVAWSQTLVERLEQAQAELSRKQGLKDEKGWLMLATDRLTAAAVELGDLPVRAMRLPELESAREEQSRALLNAVVDAVERLQAGITFTAGARSPLLEPLFGKVKLPQARRFEREDFERFFLDFDKRLSSSYCKRMLAESTYAPVLPVIEQVRTSFAAWKASFVPEPLSPAQEAVLREEIIGHARRLELPMRQARLLAEAALAPLKNAFEESGIGQKPKRRGLLRSVVTESDEPVVHEQVEDPEHAEAIEHLEVESAPVEAPVEAEAVTAVAPRKRRRVTRAEA